MYIYIYDMFIIIYAHVQLNAPLTYRILYILHSYIYIYGISSKLEMRDGMPLHPSPQLNRDVGLFGD